MTMTATRQRNAVSEGAALGLVALGYDRIPFDKVQVDLAFGGAWRDWSYGGRFSQVNTDLKNGLDEVHALTRATEGKRTMSFYWDHGGRELTIFWRHHDFDPHSGEDLEWAARMIDGDVPLEGWKALAQGFLDRYRH